MTGTGRWDDDADDDDALGAGRWDDDPDDRGAADVNRAPICPACGVTALPAELSHVLDATFVCENPDCDAFGSPV